MWWPNLVADEEGDAGLGLRSELGHQPVGCSHADEHRLIAAAVGRTVTGIEPIAIGRRQPRDELHADGGHLHGAALHQPAPRRDGIIDRPGDDGAQAQFGRRGAAIVAEGTGRAPEEGASGRPGGRRVDLG